MSRLTKDSWILLSVVITFLVDVYKENLTSQRYVVGEEYFITFPCNYGYSSLILHQNSTRGNILKVVL